MPIGNSHSDRPNSDEPTRGQSNKRLDWPTYLTDSGTLPETRESAWIRDTILAIQAAQLKPVFYTIQQAAEVLEQAIRTSSSLSTIRHLSSVLGRMPLKENVDALFRLILEPSSLSVTGDSEIPDVRVFHAASALLLATESHHKQAQSDDRFIRLSESFTIRERLDVIAANRSLPESTRVSVSLAIQSDKEKLSAAG